MTTSEPLRAEPKDTFFVRLGLGETMTVQDILEGRLIIEVGMTVVCPAEFIVLRIADEGITKKRG